jgi:lipopolysaccharide/colanic/teichoic acid biosynthesis glycosyltransferase
VKSPAETRPRAWALKRGLDIVGAAVGLVALAPALALLGAAVALDSPGGPLFVQERVGRGGRRFAMLKLRTMRAGAPMQLNPDGSTRVAAVDARVTRVGRVLRRGLDELPQLVNVLRGDMSLVGPRPDLPMHAATYSDAERERLLVRPGMTGLAAVLGRNELAWRRRLAIDRRYVAGWRLRLDLAIIAQTLLLPTAWRPFRFDALLADLPPP